MKKLRIEIITNSWDTIELLREDIKKITEINTTIIIMSIGLLIMVKNEWPLLLLGIPILINIMVKISHNKWRKENESRKI